MRLHPQRRLPAVTVSIKRVSAGDGYRYLMRSVAAGDGAQAGVGAMTRYYAESGNPPGQWLGAGLAGLDAGRGLAVGSQVSEEQMLRLFGLGFDPVTGEQLGRRAYRIGPSGRAPVAGFDLTFSAPKSVSAWWAVADAATQQVIVDAHHAALQASVGLLEREVAATRIGRNGVAQADVRGLLAAPFDHWDSRAGDPQLHTHVVVANRVQGLDGQWRTLDSRALYRSVVAISETYNALLADELTVRTGVTWRPRARRPGAAPAWEIADVPAALLAEFSQRTKAIEAHKDTLVAGFRAWHGRDPSATEVLRLRQQATLATRPPKHLHTLGELCQLWRDRAARILGMDAGAWAKRVGGNPAELPGGAGLSGVLGPAELDAIGGAVVAAVETKRPTWSRWNLHAETSRQLMDHRFATPAARFAVTEQVVDRAVAGSVLLTAPALTQTPDRFRRTDGTSMFVHQHSQTYTSSRLLDAEARLLDAVGDLTAATVPAAKLRAALAVPPPGHRYLRGASQVAAVTAIAASGRTVDVLVGAAGTGKTAALAGLRAAWESQHGPGSVIGLAPSANAADILAGELRIGTENTAKWLTEHDREPLRLAEIDHTRALLHKLSPGDPATARRLQQRIDLLTAEVEAWRLHPGQLLVLDEASLAATITLARITEHAATAGAKVLLVGDPAQLSAVDAGGGFALLVREHPNPAQLTAVRRFTNPWERAASQRLRTGDPTVLDTYLEHGRIHGGHADTMLDAAYTAWLADENTGHRSLLVAADAATVNDLNARARAVLVAAGRVHAGGVPLHDGSVAGVGDRVVTRRNDRTLSTGRGFVKNGDSWIVLARGADGSLIVHRPGGGPTIALPGDYVGQHVDLGYATTVHRAQGLTVDTAHAVIGATGVTRESLYVAMTRGRHANTAYVMTDEDPSCAPVAGPGTVREVLAAVLRRQGGDEAAHVALRAEQDRVVSITQLADEYETIAAAAQEATWTRLLAAAGLAADHVESLQTSPAFGPLSTALRRAEAGGHDIRRALPGLLTSRGLGDATDVAAVLHERLTRWVAAQPAPRGEGSLIAGLIPTATSDDPQTDAALRERARLIDQRAHAVLATALATGQRWVRTLGDPPDDPTGRAAWMRSALTVAAYRDRYPDDTRQPAPEETQAARTALRTAVRLADTTPTRDFTPDHAPTLGL